MSSGDVVYCYECGSKTSKNSKFCPTCGNSLADQREEEKNPFDQPDIESTQDLDNELKQATDPSSEQKEFEPYNEISTGYQPLAKGDKVINAPYSESAYLNGGYVRSGEPYPPRFFKLDNLLKGVGNLFKSSWRDIFKIYLVFIVLCAYFAIRLTPSLNSWIFTTFPGTSQDQSLYQLITNFTTIFLTSSFVATTSWIPAIFYLRRLDNYEEERDEGWSGSISYSLKKILSYLFTKILRGMIMVLIGGFALSPLIYFLLTGGRTLASASGLAFMLLTIPIGLILLIYTQIKLLPATALVIIDDLSPIAALSKSWKLTNGSFSQIFIVDLGKGVAVQILQGIISQFAFPLFFFLSDSVASSIGLFLGLLIALPLNVMVEAAVVYYTKLYHHQKTFSPHLKLSAHQY